MKKMELIRMENKPYYSTSEAGEILCLTSRTVRRLCEDGELEHYRFGSTIRITPEQLDNYIKKSLRKGE